ncbi:TRAP transporter small permease [Tateyamaria pelophila]|uniref:TRAP transporter small permease n=1 Tax=Tateyamaria pelophila TaxID=328415 RepID=UPI001CC0FCF6|nr:TRAP transporter small permease subunit [Tateyamaria pelophila]
MELLTLSDEVSHNMTDGIALWSWTFAETRDDEFAMRLCGGVEEAGQLREQPLKRVRVEPFSPDPTLGAGHMLAKFELMHNRLSDIGLWCSMAALISIATLTFVATMSRNFFNAPIAWAPDRSGYLLACSIFVTTSAVSRHGQNVAMDILATIFTGPISRRRPCRHVPGPDHHKLDYLEFSRFCICGRYGHGGRVSYLAMLDAASDRYQTAGTARAAPK